MNILDLVKSAKDKVQERIYEWSDVWSAVINDIVSQSWTIFGLLVGWVVLPDGDTRNFVGMTLLVLCFVWAATMPIRLKND